MVDPVAMIQDQLADAIEAAVEDPVQRALMIAMLRRDISTVREIVNSGFKFRLEPQVLSREILGMALPPSSPRSGDIFRTFYLQYIAMGDLEMTELMLRAEADMDCKTQWGDGPLPLATKIQDRDVRWKMVKLLMESGVSPVNENLKYRSTSIHEAVSVRDIELVKFYMNAGAQLNCLDVSGMHSPLHFAVRHASTDETQFELVKQLVELGANINITGNDGSTVLHYLIENQDTNQEEHTWKLIKLLLDLGANLNVINQEKISPLALVAAANQYELVERLVEAGADVNVSRQCTGSPLQLAVSRNNHTIVELLLKRGANINARDEDGNNILYYAAELTEYKPKHGRSFTDFFPQPKKVNENLNILKMILAHGVPVDCPEYGKYKPFKSALGSGNFGAVNLFLENGLRIEKSGVVYPLHQAALGEDDEVLKYLLAKRMFDVDGINDSGFTPLFIATGHRRCASVLELIKSGANVNMACKEIDMNDPSIIHLRSPLSKAIVTGPLEAFGDLRSGLNFHFANDMRIVDILVAAGANIDTPDVFQACQILVSSIRNRVRGHRLNPNDVIGQNRVPHDPYDMMSRFLIDPLIKQIALLKMRNHPLNMGFEECLAENTPDFPQMMEQCLNELEVLKTAMLYEPVTLYDLLIGKDVTRLVNNEQIAAILDSFEFCKQFKMYASRLRNCFMIAKVKREAMDESLEVLKKLLGFHFDKQHLVLHKIMEQLTIKDLRTVSSMRYQN